MANNSKKTRSKIDIKKGKEKQIAAPLEKLPGVYTNSAVIHHTKNEFVLDFILDVAGQANFVSRVITSPYHMKRLNNVITNNLKHFEEKFGEIKIEE
jgi:hypothetical protein